MAAGQGAVHWFGTVVILGIKAKGFALLDGKFIMVEPTARGDTVKLFGLSQVTKSHLRAFVS